MKLLLLIVIGVVVVITEKIPGETLEQWEQIISGYKNKCLEKSGVDPALPHDMETHLNFVDDEALKCYYSCIYEHSEVFDANGQFSVEKFSQKFPMCSLEMSSKCASPTLHLEECEKSYQMAKCIIIELAA